VTQAACRGVVAALLAVLLAGCGFRLIGDRPLPVLLQRVYLDVVAPFQVREPQVETHLRALLTRRGARVVSRAEPDVTEVRIQRPETLREVLSVGTDGKALEFILRTTVRYSVRRGETVLIPEDVIEVSRDFSFNADQVLAKDVEEARLQAFIQSEIAELILLRLEMRLKSITPPPVPVPPPATSPGA
jgi:LPS-assembly lipoprotein